MKNKPIKLKCFSDYILINPDRPDGGSFDVGNTFINETATIEDVGPLCSEEVKDIKGKRVIFCSWKCEEKTIEGKKYYLVPESANVICATI